MLLLSRSSLILIIIALLSCVLAFPNSIFNGRELDDLGASNATFDQEANSWGAVGLLGTSKTTICNGIPMLGGPSILRSGGYFQKFLGSLPNHDSINFRIRIFLIDNWQQSDSIVLQFDGKNVSLGDIAPSTPDFPSNFCGDPNYPDLDSFYVVGRVYHNQSNVTVRIISKIDRSPNIASFGVGRMTLTFTNTTITNEGDPQDISCNIASIPSIPNSCGCPSGTYSDPFNPGICYPCHSNCAECFGPSASQCYACKSGMSYLGTSCSQCNETCATCSSTAPNACLRCPPGSWYKWDRTCQSICESPINSQDVIGDVQICKEPCVPGEFYYWNTSCRSTCPSPLSSSSNIYGSFCNRPCSSTAYRYWNRSCIGTCPYPLVKSNFENIVKLCDKPCKNTEFFYPSGECLTTCQYPLVIKIENEVQHCLSPCKANEYFYDFNDTCISTCNSPNYVVIGPIYNKCVYVMPTGTGTSTNNNVTNNTSNNNTSNNNTSNENDYHTLLTTAEIDHVMAMATTFDTGGQVLSVTTALSSFIGASNPASSTLAGFIKMLPYIRYIKITYPPKLQMMLDNMNSTLVSFALGPAITQEQQDYFPKYPVPENFDKYGYHSSFLVNYWQTLISLLILLAVILFLTVLSRLLKKKKGLQSIVDGLKLILKWNFFLMILCTNFDCIVLGTSLQLRTVYFDSFATALSVICCLVMNIITFFVLGLAIYIIRDIRKSKALVFPLNSQKKAINPETKWQEFQLFYKGSKDEKLVTHIFMLPYLLRICFFNFIISYFFEYPLAQAILITLLSLFLLTYMVWKRPFVSQLVFCQHTSDEVIMFLTNLCMLGLAVLDYWESNDDAARESLGNIIIYANIVFNITANVYLIAYLAVGFKAAYDNTKLHKKRGLLAWLTALLAPFEAGGMDLEVVPQKEEETAHPSPLMSKKELGHNSLLMDTESIRPNDQKPAELESFVSSSYFRDSNNDANALQCLIKDKGPALPPSPLSMFNFSPMDTPDQKGDIIKTKTNSTRNSPQLTKGGFLQEDDPSLPKVISRPRRSIRLSTFSPLVLNKETGQESIFMENDSFTSNKYPLGRRFDISKSYLKDRLEGKEPTLFLKDNNYKSAPLVTSTLQNIQNLDSQKADSFGTKSSGSQQSPTEIPKISVFQEEDPVLLPEVFSQNRRSVRSSNFLGKDIKIIVCDMDEGKPKQEEGIQPRSGINSGIFDLKTQ